MFPAPSDYTSSSSIISFEANSLSTTVVVPIVDDTISEQAEVFYGTLTSSESTNIQITEDRSEIHIIDNDGRHYISIMFF